MPITIYTEQQISDQALAFLRNRFPGRDSSNASFLGKIARVFGMLAAGIQKAALDADNDSVPSTKNSTAALDQFAYVFGIPSGVPGQYGRKAATPSGGGVGLFTGTLGTVYPTGLQALAPDGVTIVQVATSVTIAGTPPGSGSVSGTLSAVTPGSVGNIPAGGLLSWVTPPTGSDSTFTLTTGLSGGLDLETDSALLTRILERLQQPPKGGTASDYRQWAESVNGVLRAYVYPLRGGLGTVHVVLTGPGSGTGRNPGTVVQMNVDAYINSVRPVTVSGYQSFLPYQPGSGMNVRIRVVPNGTSNAFDWTDGGTALTAGTYTAPSGGSPATLVLSSLPASLAAAIAANKLPRLQILSSTTGAPTNQQVQVASVVSGTTVALINPLPSGFVRPTGGDLIYAGGPVVAPVAAGVLGYIDSLGPSRASGYASSLDVWEDTAAIARITQVTLDQQDANNVRLCNNVTSASINGSSTDVEATDNTINGPQLLFAQWVSVTS